MEMSTLTFAVSCAIFGAVFGAPKTQTVNTKYGKVEGSLASNGFYYEYMGIRYAVPTHKFQASVFSKSNIFCTDSNSNFV